MADSNRVPEPFENRVNILANKMVDGFVQYQAKIGKAWFPWEIVAAKFLIAADVYYPDWASCADDLDEEKTWDVQKRLVRAFVVVRQDDAGFTLPVSDEDWFKRALKYAETWFEKDQEERQARSERRQQPRSPRKPARPPHRSQDRQRPQAKSDPQDAPELQPSF